MKKLIFLSLAATLISSISFSTIRRIQYWGTPVAGVDYANGTLAVAASAIGDTIMFFHAAPDAFTIDKRLVIIGTGNWNWVGVDVNFNPNLQNVKPTGGYIYPLTFAPGSDGTIITGCRFSFNTNGNVAINNIKIRNCTDWGIGYWNIGNTGSNLTFDNWEFSKCYLTYGIYTRTVATNKVTNFKMFNCIGDCSIGGSPAVTLTDNAGMGQTGIIENCSFNAIGARLNLFSGSILIQNCIFRDDSPITYTNTVFNNNIFTASPVVIGTGNIFNATTNNIYTGYPTLGTNSYDGKFMLKAGSPAIGAGIGGIDCGAYGGVNPYKLSLIPAVPAIYKLTSPGVAASSNPYPITFSVRTNN